jgi:predicted restriction endonuclease
MYRCCAIPGCRVGFDHCDIHHILWYRNLGRTDIDNLLPICHKHHHLAHEGGWKLALDPRRNLTITYPDGAIMTTGPPKR